MEKFCWVSFLGIKCLKFDPIEGSKFFLKLLGEKRQIKFSNLFGLLKLLEFIDEWGEDYKLKGNEDIIGIYVFDRFTKKLMIRKLLVKDGNNVVFLSSKVQEQLENIINLIEKEMYIAMDESVICKIKVSKIGLGLVGLN